MSKKLEFWLDSKSLNKLSRQLDKYSSKMDGFAENVVSDLAEFGVKEMEDIYKNFQFQGSEPISFYAVGTSLDKRVVMAGTQAIYNEFGTGTLGEISPHPIKSSFKLNAYNTGKTIRRASSIDVSRAARQGENIPEGGLFWTFRDSNGKTRYTQGTPAQQEVYKSLLSTIDKSKEIISKRMEEVLNG